MLYKKGKKGESDLDSHSFNRLGAFHCAPILIALCVFIQTNKTNEFFSRPVILQV